MFKLIRGRAPLSFKSAALAVMATVVVALSGLSSPSAWAAADVNKASMEELRTVRGVGPGIAGRILDERKNGAYKDWPDFVARVKGIGNNNAPKFSSNGLTVNGAALTGAPAGAAVENQKGRSGARADRTGMAGSPASTTVATPESNPAAQGKKL